MGLRASTSRSSIAPTMAFSGAAGASMRRPPGARSTTISASSISSRRSACNQRRSRASSPASSGARSSVSPSTSTPRLMRHEPWSCAPRSRASGCSGVPSASSVRLPSSCSFQRCTGRLKCAKPGSTTSCQPAARRRGTCSAQKSLQCASSASDQSSPPCCTATAASRVRHCSAFGGSGARRRRTSVSRAATSVPGGSSATVSCAPRGPKPGAARMPSRPSPRVSVRSRSVWPAARSGGGKEAGLTTAGNPRAR